MEITIPPILRNDKLRFCKIKIKTKKPFEQDWTNKPYTWQEIQEWLESINGNYGVLCGHGDLAVIDADNKEFQLAVENVFPETYRVQTGSGGTHNYFFIPDLKQKIILNLDDEKKTHLGEVQSYGTQVVAPLSIHPNGKRYKEINQNLIATISCEELFEKLKPFMKKEIEDTEQNLQWERTEHSEIDDLSVANIWGTGGLKKHGEEYYGCHPIHGSSGGMNFWINSSKNSWHCFRCNSGGGVLSAIAVKEGIIDCSEARRGNLRGDKAIQSIEKAKEKYGLKQTWEQEYKNPDGTYKKVLGNVPKDEIKIIWEHELPNYVEEEKEWIVEKLIPTKSVCVITGKRGTLKTFMTLLMAYSVASGSDFLNKYSTRRGGVIYLDKENGIGIMKERTQMIKKGMELEGKELPIGFICFSQLKIDRINDISAIEEIIQKHSPLLLIVDTYRRGISFDENDAGEVSKLFVDVLRPIVEKYDISIILIHHNKKGESSGDEMDMLRGSSDLANYADIILQMDRKGNSLILKQLKNRNAQEELPAKISSDFGEDYIKFWYDGEFIKKNSAEKFMEDIILWVTNNNIENFSTTEIKELALQKGVKKNNMHNALIELENRGIISHQKYGKYQFNKV